MSVTLQTDRLLLRMFREEDVDAYAQMCADPDVDLIDAGTSPVLREKIVTAALKHSKHVVNQMPFAPSAASARRLYDLQFESDRYERRSTESAEAEVLEGIQ